MNPHYLMYDGARNDQKMNQYCRGIAMLWSANTNANPCTFLKLQVGGRGGTGKTFVLNLICASLREFNKEYNVDRDIVRRAAPTGVAANAINGVTIHALLRLPGAAEIRRILKDIQYLFLDEKSMIGVVTLNWIDRRMCQIFEKHDLPFGGRNVVLMGDFYQLPPVMQKALFSPNDKLRTPAKVAGRAAYVKFDKTVELTKLMRQKGEDAEARGFRQALEGLRNNMPTVADWQLLRGRVVLRLLFTRTKPLHPGDAARIPMEKRGFLYEDQDKFPLNMKYPAATGPSCTRLPSQAAPRRQHSSLPRPCLSSPATTLPPPSFYASNNENEQEISAKMRNGTRRLLYCAPKRLNKQPGLLVCRLTAPRQPGLLHPACEQG
ncbi:hypothetical protein RB596_004494 [Gaeumannomyces avenae]